MDIVSTFDDNNAANNLFGVLGPQCHVCSGLGRVLNLGLNGSSTKFASRCVCGGTGVDAEQVRAAEMSSLLKRLDVLEKVLCARERRKLGITSKSTRDQGKLSRQYWMELIAWATTTGTAVASTTSDTIVFPNITIPANYMNDSRQLRLRANGAYSTLGSGTVTLVFSVKWNGAAGTVICKTGAITVLISMANALWDIDVILSTRVNGSAGAILGNGLATVFGGTAPTIGSATGAPAVAPMTQGGQTVPANATALDLTADTPLSLTVAPGANSASNTITGWQYIVESMN